ncbi:MAG TPA: TolC family protein [Bryobacteraceae bacterium]|nr:TolC family protein [Bryobacteraceae bacterium]
MKRIGLLAAFLPIILTAEVRSLTLPEAIDTALKQNPDVIIARLEEQKASEQVGIARDPFTPRVIVGSGLAATFGFPMSIEGSAPSIFQGRWIQSLYNKPRSYEVAAARENVRGASIDSSAKRDDVAFQTASLYLDLEQIVRAGELARQQSSSYERIAEAVQARVEEGRELPIEVRRAQLRLAQARQRLAELDSSRDIAETNLAVVLGYPPEDRVRVVPREQDLAAPGPDEASIDLALANSKELKRLESAMQARGMEVRSARSARLPQVDLVAQYALFSRFNNYEEYFQRFERHNGQFGVSLALPILPGGGAKARAAQAEVEITRLRTQHSAVRSRIVLDIRRAQSELEKAGLGRDVAKLDLDLAREQLGVLLAQFEEGRATLRQVEESRAAEAEKWLGFHEARHNWERARLNLLKTTGTLIASLR